MPVLVPVSFKTIKKQPLSTVPHGKKNQMMLIKQHWNDWGSLEIAKEAPKDLHSLCMLADV